MPLLERINDRKLCQKCGEYYVYRDGLCGICFAETGQLPTVIAERMSPFMRRLREKNLPAKELYNGAWVSRGEDGAA